MWVSCHTRVCKVHVARFGVKGDVMLLQCARLFCSWWWDLSVDVIVLGSGCLDLWFEPFLIPEPKRNTCGVECHLHESESITAWLRRSAGYGSHTPVLKCSAVQRYLLAHSEQNRVWVRACGCLYEMRAAASHCRR
mmetsp:Transcript_17200/g.45042  ORF Transcript_17200/g.45042 Transcript_17200/m.45042 type:complete len:136 (-) Transcript_17200:1259-1666(-)